MQSLVTDLESVTKLNPLTEPQLPILKRSLVLCLVPQPPFHRKKQSQR
jgi:hypothetical protein